MRALLIFLVLGLLFVLVRNGSGLAPGFGDLNPLLLGYGALFVAGIVAAELLRPLLGMMSATARFVVVALLAALVWVGFEQARLAGTLPDTVLNPAKRSGPPQQPVRQTRLKPAWDGVYRAIAQVNRMSLGVLIDPATPLVILEFNEAERLGFATDTLRFSARVPAGDRKINVAPVALMSVRVNDVELLDVKGAIAAPGALETSLIGLSFLGRLSTVAMFDGDLILRQ